MLNFSKTPIILKIITKKTTKKTAINTESLLVFLFLVLFTNELFGQQIIKQSSNLIDKTVCVIGDSGTGKEQQHQVAKALVKQNCDLIIHLGDIIYPRGIKNSNDPEFQEKFYLPYKDIINQAKAPQFHIILGNHDYDGNSESWLKLHHAKNYIFYPSPYYIEEYTNVCLFFVDGTPFHRLNLFKAWKQFKFFKHFFQNKNKCKFTMALNHYPYLSSGKHGDASWIMKWVYEKLFVGHVDLIISGHDHHLAHEGVVNGTHLFISGAAGKLRNVNSNRALFTVSTPGYIAIRYLIKDKEVQAGINIMDSKNNVIYSKTVIGKGLRN